MKQLTVWLVLFGAFACGDDEDTADTSGSIDPDGPLYVYGTDVFGDDSTTGFLGAVGGLDGQIGDLSQAVEIPGGGMRFDVIPGTQSIVVRDRENIGMRRFEVSDAGEFVDTGFVSFQGEGVTNMNTPNVVVSATRMVYFSLDGFAIEWNPTEMAIEETVTIPTDNPPAGATVAILNPVEVSGDRVISFLVWVDENFEIEFGNDIIVYDLNTQTFSVTDESARDCAAFFSPFDAVPAPDGFVYYANAANSSGAAVVFEDFPTRPCLRRRLPGSDTFDASFVRYLDEGDALFGGLFAIDSSLFVTQELDRTLAPGDPTFETLNETPVWRWRQIDSFDPLEVSDLGLDPASGQFDSFTLDGTTYLHNWDDADTRLLDLSGDNPTTVFQVTGYVRGFARLR
ncbi:MAG: hypothetical protein AAF735_03875 [Myxococcota bacterium]